MIIGYEAKRAFHNASGLGNYSRNLIRLMAQHHPENQYLLYNPSRGNQNFGEYLPSVHEKRPFVSNRLYRNLWRQSFVSDRAFKDNVEVFHGLSQELPIGLRKKGIPSVVTVHDVIFLRYPELYKYIDRKIYLRKLRSACNRANLIVATSEQTRSDLQEFLKIEKDRIKVVYQGVNPVFWSKYSHMELMEVQQRMNLPERFALFVGTLEPRKSVDRILQAQLKTGIPVVYVGKKTGFWKKELNKRQYRGIQKLIYNPEVPSNEELAKLYRLASIFIYPSLFEGFGIPVLEALIAQVPVITSNTSSLPEVAGPKSVLIHPENPEDLAEAMMRLWNDPDECEQMRKAGFTFAQNFRDEVIARHWNKIYESLKSLHG